MNPPPLGVSRPPECMAGHRAKLEGFGTRRF